MPLPLQKGIAKAFGTRLKQLVYPLVLLHITVELGGELLVYHHPALWGISSRRMGVYEQPGKGHMKTVKYADSYWIPVWDFYERPTARKM